MANEGAPDEVQTEWSRLCMLIYEQKDAVKNSDDQIWVIWV